MASRTGQWDRGTSFPLGKMLTRGRVNWDATLVLSLIARILTPGCRGKPAVQENRMNRDDQLPQLISRARAFIEAGQAAAFAGLALEVFQFQFARNPVYQRYCQSVGLTPANVAGWTEIPAVVTSAFKEADWTVLPPAERTTVFHSSGTTTLARGRHFHSRATIALYETSLLAWFKPFVLPDLELAEFCVLTPPPEDVPNSSLAHMFGTVARVFGKASYHARVDEEGAWILNGGSIAAKAHELPVVLCGTAFSFVHLCDWARETGARLKFPEGSRVFETGGYKGRSRAVPKNDLHRMIAATCGVPHERIVSEYGMSELSSQAYDRRCGDAGPRLFRFPPWARARVISPENGREAGEGEPGLIRVHDLANIGSVMAVQTEDLGIRRGEGIELLGRATLAEARGCSLMPAA
jgi:hypothetical protein